MRKAISILDKDYKQWLSELSSRYRRSQIKAAVKVNEEMLRFYWELGRDIVEMKAESRWGSGFMKNLSRDLKTANPRCDLLFADKSAVYEEFLSSIQSVCCNYSPSWGANNSTGC